MALKLAHLTFDITYDNDFTTAIELAAAIDELLVRALSIINTLEVYGKPEIGNIKVDFDCFVDWD